MKKEKQIIPQIEEITIKKIRDSLKENMGTILGNINRVMIDKNINQKELAYRIDSHESHVSRMLKSDYHKNGLTIKVLTRISLGLDVKLNELIK